MAFAIMSVIVVTMRGLELLYNRRTAMELRERAARMVLDHQSEHASEWVGRRLVPEDGRAIWSVAGSVSGG